MKQISGRELARLIQQRGLEIGAHSRQSSHLTMSGRRERLVIPIHGNQPLKTGLLRSLMKIADLKKRDL